MRISIIISFVAGLIVLSCKNNNSSLRLLNTSGIEGDNLKFSSLFFMSDTGFMVGSSDHVVSNPDFPEKDSNQFAFLKQEAVIFNTEDGGRSWKLKEFGEGSFQSITKIRNNLFAIKISFEDSNSHIYRSIDNGKNWTNFISFTGTIADILECNDQLYLIARAGNGIFLLYKVVLPEKSFQPQNLPLPIFDAITDNTTLIYLSSDIADNFKRNLLILYNTQDSTVKSIELPPLFDCQFLYKYEDGIKLMGIENNSITVYSLTQHNDLIHFLSYTTKDSLFPQGYFHNKQQDWIVAGKEENEQIVNKIYRTKNNGKTWEVIDFYNDKYIQPFCFNPHDVKERAWFYSGSGQFQVLEND